MHGFAIGTFVAGTIMIGGVCYWRARREPHRRWWFLGAFALYLAAIGGAFIIPKGWIPSSSPGHPSWLDIAILGFLIFSFGLAYWKEPTRRLRYALIMTPLIVLLFFTNIVYPLVWQH